MATQAGAAPAASTTAATPLSPTSTPRRPNPRGDFGARRGNNRGSGGQQRGRGRGQRGAAQDLQPRPIQPTQPAPQLEEELPELHKTLSNRTDATEADVCFICASPVVHNSVAPCNHRTCHICALRLRALYKTKQCAHCRSQAEHVIFTDDPMKRYEDFTATDFSRSDDNLGIRYENNEIFDDTVLLLRYNCPDASCDIACRGWPDLHRHVRNVHHKSMCDLCTRNKKVFTHEHTLFAGKELSRHEKFGDDNPGAVDQSGFKGHPECGFCRQRFYGDDELYAHCRDRHERCHICDRRNSGGQPQYYLDYNALEEHFSKEHFLCLDQECLDKKFIVFESEMDLKGHQLETHPNGMSKDVRRDARVVDLSSFDYRAPYQVTRGRGREPREGRGRGRDPNSEPLPPSTAQPMRRDEIAYQRQLAVQSAQSVANRTFGGQLTPADTTSTRLSTRSAETTSRPTNAADIPLGSLSLNSNTDTPRASGHTPTAQEQARQLRHNAVNERAANLLQHDQTKMAEFRSKVSAYRSSNLSATELIDAFFTLFDASSTELGKLVKELAELFDATQKRDDLLRSWNDWRAINEDYPSLPGPSGVPAGTSASTLEGGGKRILKLKSSTAQSSRSVVSRQGGWGSAASTVFPPIAPASANRAGAGKVGTTPWAASKVTKATPAQTSRPPTSASPGPAGNADLFPALPAAQKPGMNVVRPGYMGNPTKRDSGSNTPVNAWSKGPLSDERLASALNASLNEDATEGAKKKGKKKQTLIHWG